MCSPKPRICIDLLGVSAIAFGSILLGMAIVFTMFFKQFDMSYAEAARYHSECQAALTDEGQVCSLGFIVLEADGHP